MVLLGRNALVTGGANGIGLAIARRFADEGASVYLADLDGSAAVERAASMRSAKALTLDVSDLSSIERMVDSIAGDLGEIDVLVNCAGSYHFGSMDGVTPEDYDRIFATNVKGTLFVTKAVAGLMPRRPHRRKVINIASLAARRGVEHEPLYCASKAAVVSLTQSLALDLIKRNINVNAISPGLVMTDMFSTVVGNWANLRGTTDADMMGMIAKNIPAGYISNPEDLTGCALWLASSGSDYVVGQTINVDGGKWMS